MKRIISIIILLITIGGGYWWFMQFGITTPVAALEPTTLTGSGTIEAETVAITAELGGRILELKVDEGDEVTAGQALVELEQADLLAQRTQLETALATAQANLELASASARPEEVAAAQAQVAQAEVAQEGARLIWQRAKAQADDPYELDARINQARARVTEAERNLEMAQVNLKQMEIQAEAASRNQTTVLGGNEGLVQGQAAQYRFQAAQTGIEMAEVALAGAKKQVEYLVQLRERPLPLIAQANAAAAAYRQAEAAVLAAAANLAAVKAEPTLEDIAVAQAQVLEAEAALATVDVQLAKQTLIAPRDGLIGRKLVNPGELAAPGSILLELNNIDTVDLTVYLPETQIGQVKIGQKARVYVDAYPGEAFEGTVSFIAHEAEFTPRNVQTPEERANLVFAVKVKLNNADHRLKPGMPADAILEEWKPGSLEAWKNGGVEDWKSENKPTNLPTPPSFATPTLQPTATPTFRAEPDPSQRRAERGQDEAFQPSNPPPLQPEAAPVTQAEIIAWGLNVRSGPGIDYPVIATLTQGDIVTVIEVDADIGWFQVRLPAAEKIGWISGSPTYVAIR